ncbi:MAG: methionyl-tRNA formyltransferase [Verrucomicrobiota bacterium]
MKIGYFADGPWSHRAIKKILLDPTLEITFICARYDNPDLILKQIAIEYKIPFLTHPKINADEFIGHIQNLQSDIFVSMSFNQIFKEKIIEIPRYRTINCHAGALPFYRGRNILNWALINDEKDFGITVHYVDVGIDTGDILIQKKYPITDKDNYKSLLEFAHQECAELLLEAIKLVQSNQVKPIKQNEIHPIGFYCTQRKEGDEIINWENSSREIFNFVRAITEPGPVARTFLNDNEIKIHEVKWIKEAPRFKGIEGAVIGVDDEGFSVKTGDSFVKIIKFEGYKNPKIGDRFSNSKK